MRSFIIGTCFFAVNTTMKKINQPCVWIALLCIVGFAATGKQVQASISTSTETVTGFANTASNPPNPFNITFSGLPTDSLTGGILTLETFGDFNSSSEWIDISIDGTSFGRLWDRNTGNDSFVGSTIDDDRGLEYGSFGSNAAATLQLSEADLDGFFADGEFVINFGFGPDVGNISSNPDEFITATLDFEIENASTQGVVPEPTTFAVWSLLGVMGLCRRLRRRAR